MALSNSQYNAIMRTYNQKQLDNKHDQDRRVQEIY
ncbi:MAG: DNA replication protein DnaC, partial [Hungatella sp.]